MKQISIQLTAESPLAIRADHAPGGAAAATYIPGTAFIGGLAAVYRMLHPDKSEKFEQLFLHELVQYPDLYPAMFKDEEIQELSYPVYPVPKTAQSCKRHPGFLHPRNEENDAHGVRDSLVDWALFKLGEKDKGSEALVLLKKHKDCRKCNATMDHFSGYYRRDLLKPEQIFGATIEEHTRLQTRTGIDRASGTVQEGILYNRRVFEEGMRFWGTIRVPDDEKLLSDLISFLMMVGEQGLVRIGTGRTRGMGMVKFQAELVERDPFADFKERLTILDELIRGQSDELLNLHDPRFFFALTLHSPLILCDEFLRYRGTIDGQTLLKELLPWEEQIEVERIYQAASVRRMTGWQEIWGTPRMNEYAIDTGSVFLFACNVAEGTPEKEILLRKLFKLEEHGAGARCAEGFGRVRVSDQFHQERDER
jgi:CRISPR-associated protein Csx10